MPSYQVGNTTLTDQQLKDYWGTGRDANQIAADAAKVGATPDQIAQAVSVASGGTVNNTGKDVLDYYNKTPSLNQTYDWNAPGGGLGIIQQAQKKELTPATYTPTQSASSQFIDSAMSKPAQTIAFDPSKQTVSGQLQGIIAQNSPYIQQARAAGMQAANDRGLINSSMAAGATEAAAIAAAGGIANADANIYNNNAQQNAAMQNNWQGQVLGAATSTNNANNQLSAQTSIANLDAQVKTNVASLQDATTRYGYQLDADTKAKIAQMQTDSTAATNLSGEAKQRMATVTQLNNTYLEAATNILNNNNLSPEQKTANLNNLDTARITSLKAIGVIDAVPIDWDLGATPLPTQPEAPVSRPDNG